MAWWHRAYVGQKVVCVDEGNWCGMPSPLKRGGVYTVDRVVACCDAPRNWATAPAGTVVLLEIANPFETDGAKGFHPARFRPVQTRDTTAQVEKLKRILIPQRRQRETA